MLIKNICTIKVSSQGWFTHVLSLHYNAVTVKYKRELHLK